MSVVSIVEKSSSKPGASAWTAQGRQIISTSVASALDALDRALRPTTSSVGHTVAICGQALKAVEANRQVGRLWAMSSASEDWDGQGAAAPDIDGIRAAETLLVKLAAGGLDIPTASIGSEGQSTLFWDWGDTLADLELEPGKATYVLVRNGTPMLHEEVYDPDYIPGYLMTYLMERSAKK